MRGLNLLYAFLGGAIVGAGASLLSLPKRVRIFVDKSSIFLRNTAFANARRKRNLRISLTKLLPKSKSHNLSALGALTKEGGLPWAEPFLNESGGETGRQ